MVSSATAVLPVWRSPMISSRWPRPIGISASIALRPVGIGSCTDLRGMMPGALTSTRARRVGIDRALAVDRIAERVDDAAEQFLADRHVDDGAGALDRLAFLDVAVGAEDDDADIVGFEVQRHAADAVLELDHFAGLDIVEAVDAGDAVADRQNLADLGDLGFIAEIGDLVLQDRGNLCGADIHQPTSFMRVRSELSLVLSEPSTMREPSLTMRPPMIDGIDLDGDLDGLAAGHLGERAFQRRDMRIRQRLGDGDLGADAALGLIVQLVEVADHVGDGEQPALGRDELDEIGGDARNAGAGENGVERLHLLFGRKDRALDEALEIVALGDERGEIFKVLGDLVGQALLLGELIERQGIAAGHSGYDAFVLRQDD